MIRKKIEFPKGNAARRAKIIELMGYGLLKVLPSGDVIWKGKKVNPRPTGKGYLRIKFYLGDYVDFTELHHRFVYMALMGEIPDAITVNHIDHDRKNNNPSNLRLMTREDNSSHPAESNGAAKLKEADIVAIRAMYATGSFSQQKIGDIFGVSQVQISRVVGGKNWS